MQNYDDLKTVCQSFKDCDEFQAFLESQYPELFTNCIGFGTSRGWWPILLDLAVFLESKRSSSPQISFAQVKEKFGLLRVYVEGMSAEDRDTCNQKVDEAEELSAKYCEKCGSTDDVSTDAPPHCWIKTYCKKCHERR